MRNVVFIILAALLADSPKCFANFDFNDWSASRDEFTDLSSKNGINLFQLSEKFTGRFFLVSVHFRVDTNQIRYIYANEKAKRGLRASPNNYENGAAFYKVVYKATPDPLFAASLVPAKHALVRQVMTYDKAQLKESGGWNFAVFTADGATLPGEPHETNKTCFACHSLASSRNYVFSFETAEIVPKKDFPIKNTLERDSEPDSETIRKTRDLFSFKSAKFLSLPPEIRRLIADHSGLISLMNGKMMEQKFTGYIPEVTSQLIQQTEKTGDPSLAIKESKQEVIFSYAFADVDVHHICSRNQKFMRVGGGNYLVSQNRDNFHHELLKCIGKTKDSTGIVPNPPAPSELKKGSGPLQTESASGL